MMWHNKHPSTRLFADTLAAGLAMSAYGFGVTARMFGAVSDAFAFAPHTATSAEPASEAIAAPPTKSATVLSFQSAAKAKSAKPAGASVLMADDLKLIPGIGPRLEEVLNKRGILTMAQIAGWSQADIRRVDDELKLNGRILKDDWTGQAARLAAGTRGKK